MRDFVMMASNAVVTLAPVCIPNNFLVYAGEAVMVRPPDDPPTVSASYDTYNAS
jgi:hypothetical protein